MNALLAQLLRLSSIILGKAVKQIYRNVPAMGGLFDSARRPTHRNRYPATNC